MIIIKIIIITRALVSQVKHKVQVQNQNQIESNQVFARWLGLWHIAMRETTKFDKSTTSTKHWIYVMKYDDITSPNPPSPLPAQ